MRGLYRASIYHRRQHPKEHRFTYSGYYITLDIDRMHELKNPVFGVNSFNLLSFHSKDHGYRDGRPLRHWCKQILEDSGIASDGLRIKLQTFPRVLGYVFNPVSFFFCYREDKLDAVIAEVNNTFGESHVYVVKEPARHGKVLQKRFHVSPFYPVSGEYVFRFFGQVVQIEYTEQGKTQLNTSISGKPIKWSVTNLLKCFFGHPLYTFWVIFSIHYQALMLLLKGAKFHRKPQPPLNSITYGK